MTSRKFLAFIAWLLLTVACFIFAPDAVVVVIPWMGTVTCVYIGGNIATQYIYKDKE